MPSMEIEFLNVGQGDSTLITLPNGKVVLLDCNFKDDHEHVVDYVLSKLPQDEDGNPVVDCLVITHPHDDHIGGIGKLAEKVRVREVWESGHRLYVPKEEQDKYLHYYAMLDLLRRVKGQGGKVKVLRADRRGFTGDLDETVRWYCLSPSRSYAEEERPSDEQIHEQCLVLKVEYCGNSVVFAGDTTWKAWKERIIPCYRDLLQTTILHASHHGSLTFFANSEEDEWYTEHLETMSPDVTVISVGVNDYGHPHPGAVDKYVEHTYHYYSDKGQVVRTDKLGTIVARFRDTGSYEFMPQYHRQAFGGRFYLCDARVIPDPPPDPDGTYPRRVWITFRLSISRVRGGAEVGQVIWEVQNNGVGVDKRVHDWYVGDGDGLRYKNRTMFHGLHNLYVKVLSRRGHLMAEMVHYVRVRDEGEPIDANRPR
ncbi:MAG: MBL fold metallo-hydrolase [Synergistales bacterium]|nr:MBL fold metallo-hydrolase [Synergistales bacterium]